MLRPSVRVLLVVSLFFAGTDRAAAQSSTTAVFRVDPSTTYLRTHNDPVGDPLVVDLATIGVIGGDSILIEQRGDFQNGPAPQFSDRVTGLVGVFSSRMRPDRCSRVTMAEVATSWRHFSSCWTR